MDQKRFITFIVLSMTILIGWNIFILPRLLPPRKPNPVVEKEEGDKKDDAVVARDEGDEKPVREGDAAQDGDAEQPAEKPDEGVAKNDEQQPEVRKLELPKHPLEVVHLGSQEFQSGYRQFVTLTSFGAALQEVELNDTRYRTLDKSHDPLKILTESKRGTSTLDLDVTQLPARIHDLNWELVEKFPAQAPHSAAVFRIRLDNLEVVKRYELSEVDPADPRRGEARAYALKVDLTFKNLAKKARTINYTLQGPIGVPLENVENTQKFRDIVAGFQKEGDYVDYQLMSAKTISDGKDEEWKNPFKYIGVDVQFFASLLVPEANQLETRYIESVKQEIIGPDLKERSDISVALTSVDLKLANAGAAEKADQVTHTYQLFAGPKRDDVLPVGAERVIDFGSFFGMFRVDWISRLLLDALKLFHHLTGSWGLAVICLTICVRGAMFPISIKQARSAAKMQALQPELAALKEKYGKDKEKFAREQMELFRKHNHNPFTGCLPVFLQLPIFMGLYQALNHAVDLRLAGFLWIDNLAAPDALFRMPFNLPFLGLDFNLLPFITIGLFVAQQKMFMPPPADEQAAMQQKVMNIMMVVMGVMFYKVPAGLCVYFIASSLWGMGEKKLLPKAKPGEIPIAPVAEPETGRRKRRGPDDKGTSDKPSGDDDGGGGFWDRLLKAAEKETAARRPSDKRK
jgi:YidC/Oxa1 family membrane protein insertase